MASDAYFQHQVQLSYCATIKLCSLVHYDSNVTDRVSSMFIFSTIIYSATAQAINTGFPFAPSEKQVQNRNSLNFFFSATFFVKQRKLKQLEGISIFCRLLKNRLSRISNQRKFKLAALTNALSLSLSLSLSFSLSRSLTHFLSPSLRDALSFIASLSPFLHLLSKLQLLLHTLHRCQ